MSTNDPVKRSTPDVLATISKLSGFGAELAQPPYSVVGDMEWDAGRRGIKRDSIAVLRDGLGRDDVEERTAKREGKHKHHKDKSHKRHKEKRHKHVEVSAKKSIEELRNERLTREAAESQRTHALMRNAFA